ncbi:MAG: hypothetical protein RIR93_28, partial [Actinomycetota bacterium]
MHLLLINTTLLGHLRLIKLGLINQRAY